jgi:hypothetical protein
MPAQMPQARPASQGTQKALLWVVIAALLLLGILTLLFAIGVVVYFRLR